jgi:alpha-beta hydrolase superfamily lysophospholipase
MTKSPLRSSSYQPPWYRRRLFFWLLIVIGFLLLFHIAGGWYFSGEIHSSALEPSPSDFEFDIPVLAAEGGTITLSSVDGPDELETPGVWGLAWADGYGRLTQLVTTGDDSVEWRFELVSGAPPRPGAPADLDVRAFPGDPMEAHGIAFTDVTYPSSLGDNPAWFIDGSDTTWVVLVHGNGLTRRDVLKPLPVIVANGNPALVITYRNHPLAPPDPSGRLLYGLTEWEDVAAAVDYAIGAGADDVVLVGYSMGGGIVASFLYESPLAARVRAVVLDSPMLELGAAIDLGASNRSIPVIGLPIPATLTATAKLMAGWRYDLDWGQLDYLERADEIEVPVLLFHGVEDDIVPVATSDSLADELGDQVTYHRVESAKHLESWNLDPAMYEKLLGEFLAGL